MPRWDGCSMAASHVVDFRAGCSLTTPCYKASNFDARSISGFSILYIFSRCSGALCADRPPRVGAGIRIFSKSGFAAHQPTVLWRRDWRTGRPWHAWHAAAPMNTLLQLRARAVAVSGTAMLT